MKACYIQTDTMILMGIVKHSQSSQNSKFTMSLQYFKREVRDKVDFLYADKHQSFLQGDTIITDGHDQAFSKYSNNRFANIFTISQKRRYEASSEARKSLHQVLIQIISPKVFTTKYHHTATESL